MCFRYVVLEYQHVSETENIKTTVSIAIILYDATCPEKDFERFFVWRVDLKKIKTEKLFVRLVVTRKVSDWLINVTRSCDWLIFDNQQLVSRVRRTAKGNRSKHRKF